MLLGAAPQACDGFGPDEQQLAAESWGWREKLQRSMDGCHTTGHMLAQGLAAYDELDGLNCPVPGGFQVSYVEAAGVLLSCEGRSGPAHGPTLKNLTPVTCLAGFGSEHGR